MTEFKPPWKTKDTIMFTESSYFIGQ